jgi:cation:H+ antiporter
VQILVQPALLVGGLAVAIVASDIAVRYARALAAAVGAPAFVVGVVLVALGTDLPEIANSVAAHLQDEADVNVGDSVGSTLTQYTFVLGLFPFVVALIPIERRQVAIVTVLTVAGLAATAAFVANGYLGRLEGLALVVCWAAATVVVTRAAPGHGADDPPDVRVRGHAGRAGVVLVALAAVGAGATLAVRALVELAEDLGVPEFALAFFGASMGTSAPEIAVDVTALLRGAPAIALGDALGSSMIDATLSIGVGPLVAPAGVSARLALAGTLYALVAVAAVGALLVARRRHDRRSGGALFALYVLAYVVLLAAD